MALSAESSQEASMPVCARAGPQSPKAGAAFLGIYTFAYLTVWIALITPMAMTLALRVQQIDPSGKAVSLAWIASLGALCNMLTAPVVGLMSDRTRSRMGRRRPWLMFGICGAFVGLLAVSMAGSMPMVMLGWCITQAMFAIVGSAMNAVIPDQIPEAQRGRLSGLIGMSQQLAVAAGFGITQAMGGDLFLAFMIPAVLGVAGVLWFATILPDRPADAHARPALDLRGLLRSYWVNPRLHPDFAWAWIGRFLIGMGFSIMATYTVYFLIDKLGHSPAEVPRLMLISGCLNLIATVPGALLGGIASDRLGRRKLFVVVAALLYALGMAGVAHAQGFSDYLLWSGIAGVGTGVYMAVDLALVSQVLPNPDTRAKDMGVFAIACVLPLSVAPALAPLLLAIGGPNNYTALYLAAGAFGLLGAAATLPIRGVR